MTRDATRNRLLEHGTRLILEQGYNHTGILAVLQAAAVPKGSFYHYFKTKEEFGLAVLDAYFAAHMANVERFFADQTRSPLARLRGCFEFYVEHFRSLEWRDGCLLGNMSQELADQNPTFRARLQELLGRWCRRVEECLEEARRAGELRPGLDSRLLAEFCVNSWEGAILRMKASKNVEPLLTFLSFFFDVLLHHG